MNDNQIRHMVQRFLGWKLPNDFYPDGGISFKALLGQWPSGTNLLDARQATEMVRYITEGSEVTVPPLPMLLVCPCCGTRHIDEGKFAEHPHHTHACQHCGTVWRPALVDTIGVRYLPGFESERGA